LRENGSKIGKLKHRNVKTDFLGSTSHKRLITTDFLGSTSHKRLITKGYAKF